MTDRFAASTITDDQLDALYAERDRLIAQLNGLREVARQQNVRLHAEVERLTELTAQYANQAIANGKRAEQAEAERDGAYRERAQLLAWLAAIVPSALTLAPDVDEPGWKLLFLHPDDTQLSWHISPRDDDLFEHVTRAVCDDPRVQWDGHTTAEKYDRIRSIAAARTTSDTPAVAAPATADDGLREQIAAALEAADYRRDTRRGDLADAILPVVNRRMEQLTAELHARMASQRRVASERNKALAAFNATLLKLEDATATIARVRGLREHARTEEPNAQGPTWKGLDEALDGPQAQPCWHICDRNGLGVLYCTECLAPIDEPAATKAALDAPQCCGGGPRGDCPCMYPAEAALAQRRAAGRAAQADAIDRTEHAELNRHHMRPGNDDQER